MLAGVGGLANLSMDALVRATGSSNLAGLVPWAAGMSSLGLTNRVVLSSANGVPLSSSLASGQYTDDGGMVTLPSSYLY